MIIQNNQSLALPLVRLILGICAIVLSLFFSIQFVAQGATGAGIISAIIFCIVFEFCKTVFCGDLFFYFETGQGAKALGAAILVVLLFCLSISAAVFCLTINPVKNETAATVSDSRTETLQKQIADKKALLAGCNPNYISKCIAPLNAQLSAMEGELNKTFNQSDSVIEAKAIKEFWNKAGKYFGTTGDNLFFNFAIARSVILDLLGLILISQYTATKRINSLIASHNAISNVSVQPLQNQALNGNAAQTMQQPLQPPPAAPALPKYNLKW